MKKIILFMTLVAALVACKGTKMGSSANKGINTESTIDKGHSVKEKDAIRFNPQTAVADSARSKRKDSSGTNADNSVDNADPGGVVSQTNGSTGAMASTQMSPNVSPVVDDTDLKKMYKDLQMTDEQIQTFEKSMRDFNESVKYHANGEILGTVGNEQERQLKKILKEDQWNKYLKWKKGNK